ncbi:MAG: STAS domain-containing protein [Planctomycetes bacterium]|nr:STAS domain-containing protein [Planctomycetota bacterium]
MGIQNWSDEIILINLGQEPQMGEELQTAIDLTGDDNCRDIVLDLSVVDIVTSSSIAKMLKLRKELGERQRRLVFCSVSRQTMNLFKVVALDTVFEFAENQFVALASLQMVASEK